MKIYNKSNISEYSSILFDVYVNNVMHVPDFILLLTGQSNSQGWGGVFESNSLEDSINENILNWNCYRNVWEVSSLERTIGSKPSQYQCFAFHFAKQWLKDNDRLKIGIINYGGLFQILYMFDRKILIKRIQPTSIMVL